MLNTYMVYRYQRSDVYTYIYTCCSHTQTRIYIERKRDIHIRGDIPSLQLPVQILRLNQDIIKYKVNSNQVRRSLGLLMISLLFKNKKQRLRHNGVCINIFNPSLSSTLMII